SCGRQRGRSWKPWHGCAGREGPSAWWTSTFLMPTARSLPSVAAAMRPRPTTSRDRNTGLKEQQQGAGDTSMRTLIGKLGLVLATVLMMAPAANAETIRLARSTMSIGGLPIIIAQQEGMFEKAGLTVEVNDFKGGAPAIQALASGSVEACLCAGDHVIRLT